MELIDLHVHSNHSDGTDSISELVIKVKEAGLFAFALTDHDTVSGVSEAIEEGKKHNIQIIPGTELSVSCDYGPRKGKDLHILGLFVNHKDEYLISQLNNIIINRNLRNEKMIQLLNQHGVSITLEEMYEAFPDSVLTRAHFARMIAEKGYAKDIPCAFEKYIGDNKPCYVAREHMSPREAINLIHDAGGIAILAHPMLYKLERDDTRELIRHLTNLGLDGVEAVYSTHTQSDEIFLRTIAKELSIAYTGGSDYHGSNKPYIKIGVGRGGLRIGKHILDRIRTL